MKGIKSHSESRPGLVGVDVNVNVDVAVSGKEDDADDDGASIPIHNTNTAKPMLNVRKSEINECWREDESNASGKYLKNRVSQQKRTNSFTIE